MRALAAACVLAASGCAGLWSAPSAATPRRPRFAADARTTAPGTLELEAGAVLDPEDAFESPVELKWGASESTEWFAGWQPLRWRRRAGTDGLGVGDLVLGVRERVFDGDQTRPAAMLRLEAKLPTAKQSTGLGSGETDLAAGFLVHGREERWAWTLAARLGALGDPDGPGLDGELVLAAGAETGLAAGWLGFAESKVDWIPERDRSPWSLLLGASRPLGADLVLDAGLEVGLNADAPDLRFVVGLTQNLGGPAGGGR